MYDNDPLVAWKPGTVVDPEYSAEDLRMLFDKYDNSSMALFKDTFNSNPELFLDYWISQAKGETFESDRVAVRPAIGKVQIVCQKAFHILYEISLEEVPLYVNEEPFLSKIACWRLEVAK